MTLGFKNLPTASSLQKSSHAKSFFESGCTLDDKWIITHHCDAQPSLLKFAQQSIAGYFGILNLSAFERIFQVQNQVIQFHCPN